MLLTIRAEEDMKEYDDNAGGNGIVASSRLTYADEVIDRSEVTVAGKTGTVHHEGWLENREGLGRSDDRGQPCSFHPGFWLVIKGWDEWLHYTNLGARRKMMFATTHGNSTGKADRVIALVAPVIFDVGPHGV